MRLNKKIAAFFFVFAFFAQNLTCHAFFWKKNKDFDIKSATPKENKGYEGVLPDISKYFQYKIKNSQSDVPPTMSIDEIDKPDFKPAALDDSLFLDVIIKKQKTSEYVDDLLKIIKVVENFRLNLASGCTMQQFSANTNTLDLYVMKIQKKYKDKSESLTKSYQKLQELNYRAKKIANLKYEASYFAKFQPVLDDMHSDKYLDEQTQLLLNDLDKTIFILKTQCEEAQYGEK